LLCLRCILNFRQPTPFPDRPPASSSVWLVAVASAVVVIVVGGGFGWPG
jgi:hypothetical protein